MNVYANVRPCNFNSKDLIPYSSLRPDVCAGVDFTVVRELTGGIYFGARKEDNGDGIAWDTEVYSKVEIQRVTRFAAQLCLRSDPPLALCSLDKANVLATSRLWRKVVTEVMDEEFPTIKYTHRLIDSAAMLMVKNPMALNGVIVTSNLFGDIITDEASVICGGLGMMPSASLSGVPDGKSKMKGLYEPIHGTHINKLRIICSQANQTAGSAPDISGKGLVNPLASILSVAMMLRYSLELPLEAIAVEEAVKNTIEQGIRTKDIGGTSSTREVGDAVVSNLAKLL
jgi:3-isopropylmalate dehydrogenase